MLGRNRTYTDEELIKAYNNSFNLHELLETLGLKAGGGGSYERVKQHLFRLGLPLKNKGKKRPSSKPSLNKGSTLGTDIINKIIKMRKEGGSYKGIARSLDISSSTVHKYASKVELDDNARQTMCERIRSAQIAGTAANKEKSKRKRLEHQRIGYEMARNCPQFALVCSLYWAEGGKSRNAFSFSNSDPAMLRIVTTWLHHSSYKDKWTFRCHYHPRNGLTEEQIANHWLNELAYLSVDKIKPFVQSKINDERGKKRGKLPYGTGVVSVTSTALRQHVEGGINYLKSAVFLSSFDDY